MAMSEQVKQSMLLFKEYCLTFGLKPTADGPTLVKWTGARGPMLAGTFLGEDTEMPPVAWITPEGEFFIELDEDNLQPEEPAVQAPGENLIRIAINNRMPLHPVT